MSDRLRPLAALLLALCVVLTAQAMALARGQSSAAGEMVICTGAGLVTVAVDAEGNPAGPAHICPDCALSLIAAAPAAPQARARAPDLLTVRFARTAVPAPVAARHSPVSARDPPRAA
ncbi:MULTISPECIES: hypothetical protein [unclassified Rhodosalinus]|uniref:hypothetical protein n=1 Tax=unclassified Rhodosalinus TaxID=2630183 RepID=UPI0035262952